MIQITEPDFITDLEWSSSRNQLNILLGTATSESDGEMFSANLAVGVAKHICGIQLSYFREEKRLTYLELLFCSVVLDFKIEDNMVGCKPVFKRIC